MRQGDPLSAMLFSLAMHSVYRSIADMVRAGCYAYVDDGNALGWLAECWRVWEGLPSLLVPLGLTVNPAKCELTCFRMDTVTHPDDQAALKLFQQTGLKVNTHSFRLLGCVVGSDDASVQRELATHRDFQADQLTAFRRLPQLRRQAAMVALQYLTGSVLSNRLRAMTPSSTLHHAESYDRQVLKAIHRMVGITAADGQTFDHQLRWPLSTGGFGLISAVQIAPSAYLAGAECTLRHSPAFTEVWTDVRPLDPQCSMYVAIDDSLARITALVDDLAPKGTGPRHDTEMAVLLPNSAAEFVPHYRSSPPACSIQSAVTHRISTLSFIARVAQAGKDKAKADVARFQALRVAGSSLWLQTLPTTPLLRLSDAQWRWAARLRLGMPVPIGEQGAGQGCVHPHASVREGWHPLCCTSQYGAAITGRHNAVLRTIAHHSRLILLNPRMEPTDLFADSEERPDIQLDLPDITLLADVTVAHPTAQSWRNLACSAGAAAVGDKREAAKDTAYKRVAEESGMDFTAIVLYTYGGFHRSALRFIKRLGGALDTASSLYSLTEWKRSLKEHMAMAVQRGSADIMILHTQRARRAGVGHVWKRHHARLRQLARVQEQLATPPISWHRSDGRIAGLMDLSPPSSAGDGSGSPNTSVGPVRADDSASPSGVSEFDVNASDNDVIIATVSPIVDDDMSDVVVAEEVRQPISIQNIDVDFPTPASELAGVHVEHNVNNVHDVNTVNDVNTDVHAVQGSMSQDVMEECGDGV
jgi:Reverse transcriptase (RNA-dependent DNA polymerase)